MEIKAKISKKTCKKIKKKTLLYVLNYEEIDHTSYWRNKQKLKCNI